MDIKFVQTLYIEEQRRQLIDIGSRTVYTAEQMHLQIEEPGVQRNLEI